MSEKKEKNRVPFTTTMDNVLLKKMRELSDKTRINLSKLFDEAMEDLLNKYGIETK